MPGTPKLFIHTNSFNPQNNPKRQLFILPFEETEAQKRLNNLYAKVTWQTKIEIHSDEIHSDGFAPESVSLTATQLLYRKAIKR